MQLLTDEINAPELLEFAIENLCELFSYIINGNLNIRIHRDITGEMWFGWEGRESLNNLQSQRQHVGNFGVVSA